MSKINVNSVPVNLRGAVWRSWEKTSNLSEEAKVMINRDWLKGSIDLIVELNDVFGYSLGEPEEIEKIIKREYTIAPAERAAKKLYDAGYREADVLACDKIDTPRRVVVANCLRDIENKEAKL